MGTRYGKRIVTDGLVLCLDAADNISAPHNDLPVKQGCLMWLDGADDSVFTYSSGTSVSEWRDKSGNNNHVSNSNGTYQPSRNVTINSKSAVNFSDDSLQATNVFSSTATSYTKIAVVYQTSNTSGNVISSNTGHAFYFGGSTQIRLYHNGTFVTSSVTLANNTAGIISGTVQYNSSSSASGEVFVNGTSGGTGTTSNATINSTTVQIGSFNGANYYTGYIAEVLVYDRVLSSDELTKVHNYLQNKWNIEVSDAKWYDRTANAYDGTLLNDPVHSSSEKGVFEFDGTSSIARLGDLTFMDNAVFSLEVVFECFGSTGATQILINKSRYPDRSVEFYVRSTGQIRFGLYNGSWKYLGDTYGYTTAISYNQYYHMVATSNGANTALYVNGTLVDSRSDSHTSLNNSSDPVEIGAYNASPTSGFNGNIALVRGYSKALSATEVLQNYNATKERFNL